MSSASSPSAKTPREKEPASLQTTRQMLDELDALMDRMLAIPVNDLDDPLPPPQSVVRMPSVSATLAVLETPVHDDQQQAEVGQFQVEPPPPCDIFPSYMAEVLTVQPEFAVEPAPEFAAEPPEHRTPEHRMPEHRMPEHRVPEHRIPPPEPEPIPEEAIPPALMSLAAPATHPVPDLEMRRPMRRAPTSVLLFPLVLVNAGFDAGTVWLGRPGRWLRGTQGRHVFGLSGVGLALAAGLWLLKDWLGWTW